MAATLFSIDMDGDGYIGTTDIEHALKLLTQNELNMAEIQSVSEKVIYIIL